MMAFEVERGVLHLAVDGFVRVFDDGGTCGFGFDVMRFDVVDEDGEALCAGTELRGS